MIFYVETPPEDVLELPDCAPSKVLPQDLSSAINGLQVQKYYASDLFDVKEDELVPHELFQQVNLSNTSIDSKFARKVIGLLTENDVCDKTGIKFVAKIYDSACSKESNKIGQMICNEVKQSKSAVAKLAIIYNDEVKKQTISL